MLQINNLTPKQLKQLSINGKGQVFLDGKNTSIDPSLFSDELLAFLSQNTNKEFPNGLNINEDMIKQSLQSLQNGLNTNDHIDPKVIDSDLTKEVSEILNKQTKLTLPEIKQNSQAIETINNNSDLSTILNLDPSKNEKSIFFNGKNPGVKSDIFAEKENLSKNDVTASIASGEDFINQKALLKNKIIQQNTYNHKIDGLKLEAEGLNASTKGSSIENPKLLSENVEMKTILPTALLMGENSSFKTNVDVSSGQNIKTMQFSDLKTGDGNQILNQITDYIIQAKASKEETVSLRVNHQDLGMLDITVQKLHGVNQDSMALNIGTQTLEGKVFFQENSKDLLAHLNQAGLNVLDVKVDQGSLEKKNDFDLTGQGKNQNFQNKEFSSEQNQRRHDQNRRQELWDLFKDKEAA